MDKQNTHIASQQTRKNKFPSTKSYLDDSINMLIKQFRCVSNKLSTLYFKENKTRTKNSDKNTKPESWILFSREEFHSNIKYSY